MNRSTFRMNKYLNGSAFSKTRYINGVGFEILARTPVSHLPPSYPTHTTLHESGAYKHTGKSKSTGGGCNALESAF